jgi:photoactive yellow protein
MNQRVSLRTIDVRLFDEVMLDELPFGVLQLDHAGTVLNYNEYESGLSGLPKSNVIGHNFFTEIAPCTDLKEFRGEFEELVAHKKLNATFRYYFPFPKRPREVEITMLYSRENDTVWVIVVDTDAVETSAEFFRNYRPGPGTE